MTVAITDAYASPTIASDASTYAGKNGDARYRGGQLTQSLPGQFDRYALCAASSWYGEETLDVEVRPRDGSGLKHPLLRGHGLL